MLRHWPWQIMDNNAARVHLSLACLASQRADTQSRECLCVPSMILIIELRALVSACMRPPAIVRVRARADMSVATRESQVLRRVSQDDIICAGERVYVAKATTATTTGASRDSRARTISAARKHARIRVTVARSSYFVRYRSSSTSPPPR